MSQTLQVPGQPVPLTRAPSTAIRQQKLGEQFPRVKRGATDEFRSEFLPMKSDIDHAFLEQHTKLQINTYGVVLKFLQLLSIHKLNVVTVESLTGGMIASMLVDVPTFGECIYGGFVVYDTDAKRQMVNVMTPNVYNFTTAMEMAEGALLNSRAMVALAVTGQAGPTPVDQVQYLGNVWVACSIRKPDGTFHTKTKLFDACTYKAKGPEVDFDFAQLCDTYRDEISKTNPAKQIFPPPYAHFVGRNFIRLATVKNAIVFAYRVIEEFFGNSANDSLFMTVGTPPAKVLKPSLQMAPSDEMYLDCGEPSGIIKTNLVDGAKLKINWPHDVPPSKECPETLDVSKVPQYVKNFKAYEDARIQKVAQYMMEHPTRPSLAMPGSVPASAPASGSASAPASAPASRASAPAMSSTPASRRTPPTRVTPGDEKSRVASSVLAGGADEDDATKDYFSKYVSYKQKYLQLKRTLRGE